jgi:hypothetical protein
VTKQLRALYEDIRADYGAIVTAVIGGEPRTRAGYGLSGPALEDAIDALERLGPIEKVLSISTPETILRDIQASRLPPRRRNPGLQLPESILLSRIGRSDLTPEPATTEDRHKRIERIRREEQLLAKTGSRHAPFPQKKKRIRVQPRRERCEGTTVYRKRCGLRKLPGERYCVYHLKEGT